MRVILLVLLISCLMVFGKDPFTSKEDAVGYIVIETEEGLQKYIVLEGKDGTVKLIKTDYSPDKVLMKTGESPDKVLIKEGTKK